MNHLNYDNTVVYGNGVWWLPGVLQRVSAWHRWSSSWLARRPRGVHSLQARWSCCPALSHPASESCFVNSIYFVSFAHSYVIKHMTDMSMSMVVCGVVWCGFSNLLSRSSLFHFQVGLRLLRWSSGEGRLRRLGSRHRRRDRVIHLWTIITVPYYTMIEEGRSFILEVIDTINTYTVTIYIHHLEERILQWLGSSRSLLGIINHKILRDISIIRIIRWHTGQAHTTLRPAWERVHLERRSGSVGSAE